MLQTHVNKTGSAGAMPALPAPFASHTRAIAMNRRISLALSILGLVLLLGAPLVYWATSRSDASAGNVAEIEAALTPASPAAPGAPETPGVAGPGVGSDSASTTTADPADPEPAPAPAITVAPLTLSPITPVPTPTGLRIDDLGVAAPIDPYGIDEDGQMDVPDNVTDVAWYQWGPSPGEGGSAVLAAHVDLAGQGAGVFFDLDTLDPGATVLVDFDNGETQAFEVVARQTYDKDQLPLDVIFSREGPAVLTLITCGGGFDRSSRRYDSNVVVYAVPVDLPTGAVS